MTDLSSDSKPFHGTVNTKIACLSCREKKLKCDKALPQCSRCKQKSLNCVYVQHKKTGPKPSGNSGISSSVSTRQPKKITKAPSAKVKPAPVANSISASTANPNARPTSDPNAGSASTSISNSFSPKEATSKNNVETLNSINGMSTLDMANLENLNTYNDFSTYKTWKEPKTSSELNTPINYSQFQFPINSPLPNIQPPSLSPSSSSRISVQNFMNPIQTPDGLFNQTNDTHSSGTSNNRHQFNTSLTNVTNKSFEEIIGLPSLGLTMKDIDKFHAFYFDSNTRIFKYSTQRYYNTFIKDPKRILHYSYMIWTMACFYLKEYESMVDRLYVASLAQMNDYWESNRDSFHSDILSYLHALCLKSQFEFLSGREMGAALTISSSIRLTQMYGYDQIDLSPTTLGTPAIFFRSFTLSKEQYESTNTLLQDDGLDQDIPLVEERRRVLWEVYAIDKWSSLVTGLPCALSVDSLSVIFTKLPSPTTFLPLNSDSDIQNSSSNEKNSYYLHEAMQKLDNNQVMLDINSSSSKILLLTISENIIKWCKMFLNMVELETLKSLSSIDSIRSKVDELVKNFESMHNNLLFFDLTTEPLMNIVITNTTTLLYQSVLIKFNSLFDLQLREDPSGNSIAGSEISLFKDILYEVSSMSENIIIRFVKKQRVESHLKKAPVFIVFINSVKSLFQCLAFVYRFNNILNVDIKRKRSLENTIKIASAVINGLPTKTPLVEKTKTIINNGQELLDHSPHLLSFFDSFFDSTKTY